jgi:3-deoxy-D-arabino-heptulosonate 7-phosphate (DAHP) synthase class II
MSCKVRSRSAQQCHSHHQKLVKKYGSIEALLLEFEKDMLNARKKEGKEYIPRKLPVTNA